MQRLCVSFLFAFILYLRAVPVASLSSLQGLYPHGSGLQVLSPATMKCLFLLSRGHLPEHTIAQAWPFWIYGVFVFTAP